jgi:hypothetical protein
MFSGAGSVSFITRTKRNTLIRIGDKKGRTLELCSLANVNNQTIRNNKALFVRNFILINKEDWEGSYHQDLN